MFELNVTSSLSTKKVMRVLRPVKQRQRSENNIFYEFGGAISCHPCATYENFANLVQSNTKLDPFNEYLKRFLIKEQVSVRGTGMFCRAFLAGYNGNESQKAMIWSYGRTSVTTVSSNMGGNGIFGCQGVHTVELSSPCR